MHLTLDNTASVCTLIAIVLFGWLARKTAAKKIVPSLSFSQVNKLHFSSWKSQWIAYLPFLQYAALLFFLLAFIDPHIEGSRAPSSTETSTTSQQWPTEGIAIYLDLDQSGSMSETVTATNAEGVKQTVQKMTLLKQVTTQFIKDHPSDLMGLVSFARIPKVLVPLTLDREALLNQLNQLQVVKKSEQDGTGIGYAIYKTAQLITATRHFSQEANLQQKPPYTIKSAVIIVVTDGFQDPNRLDQGNKLRTMELDDAAAFAKQQGIHLYVINIDPNFSSAQFTPHRRQLKAITEMTGGKFFLVGESQSLQEIYQSINELEKSKILRKVVPEGRQDVYRRFSFYPFLIMLGLACLISSLLLDFYLLRRVP